MTANVSVKFGMSNTNVSKEIIPTLELKPIIALTIGIPAAISEPNVISKMINAVTIPTISDVPPTSEFIEPP